MVLCLTCFWQSINEVTDCGLQVIQTVERTLQTNSSSNDGIVFHHVAENTYKILVWKTVDCVDVHCCHLLRYSLSLDTSLERQQPAVGSRKDMNTSLTGLEYSRTYCTCFYRNSSDTDSFVSQQGCFHLSSPFHSHISKQTVSFSEIFDTSSKA